MFRQYSLDNEKSPYFWSPEKKQKATNQSIPETKHDQTVDNNNDRGFDFIDCGIGAV